MSVLMTPRRTIVSTLLVSAGLAGGLAMPAHAQDALGGGDPAGPPASGRGAFDEPVGTSVAMPAWEVREPLAADISPSGQSLRPLRADAAAGSCAAETPTVMLAQAESGGARDPGGEPIPLPPVTVEGRRPGEETYKPERASSPKYTEPLRDVPQTITVVPEAVIEEQGATTLRDVLRNVPGITFNAGEGGAPPGDNLTVRGFSARNDIFVDGVRDFGLVARDPFNLEQVEVIKGPGSVYSGRGSTGGAINLVSKAPALEPFVEGALTLGAPTAVRVTADINQPVSGVGIEGTAFRLNLMKTDAKVPGRDAVEDKRWGIAPALSFGLGTPTRVTLGYFRMEQDNVPDYGIPWVPANNNVLVEYRDRPAPVSRENFYGLKNRDFEKVDTQHVTLRVEHDFSDALALRNQARFGESTRNSLVSSPRFASPNSTTITPNSPSWITYDKILDNQTDVTASFKTGPLGHSLVAGVNLSTEVNTRRTRTTTGTPPTDLFDPDPYREFTGTITENPSRGKVTGRTVGLYAFDTVTLGRHVEVIGGLRWDEFDVVGITTGSAPVDRTDRMLSWRAALVFKPMPIGSVYAAYGTSFNPSLEGLSYQTANTSIGPEKNRTYEAGTKWDLFGERLSVNGALFRIEKTNARTDPLEPGDPPEVLEGEQRVDGFEVTVAGSLTRAWRVFGGYTFLDSEVVKSNDPTEVGHRLPNTPENSFSLWTTYRLPWRLELGAGVQFVDNRYNNVSNVRSVPSYWVVDAMASYPLTEHVNVRLNVYNVTDEYYFDRLGGGHLVPGAGRSALLTTEVRF